MGLSPPIGNKHQISASAEPGSLASATATEQTDGIHTAVNEDGDGGGAKAGGEEVREEEELVEKDVRERFKRMCEVYFENVAKKLIIEHKVCYTTNDFRIINNV